MFFQFFWTISWAIQHFPFIFHYKPKLKLKQRCSQLINIREKEKRSALNLAVLPEQMGENEAFCHLSSLLVQQTEALPPKLNMCIFLFRKLKCNRNWSCYCFYFNAILLPTSKPNYSTSMTPSTILCFIQVITIEEGTLYIKSKNTKCHTW